MTRITRRMALRSTLAATGALSCAAASAASRVNRHPAHHRPRAKHVIMLYMSGAYSHVDTFDPKIRLIREHDVSIGPELRSAVSGQPTAERFLKAPLWPYRANKRCGTEVSDLFPHLRDQMHEVALIRSMHADHRDHGEA
ncbi:MAG: DUF1501 domain-containing protein, partial [Planctomycetaceae bacterium]